MCSPTLSSSEFGVAKCGCVEWADGATQLLPFRGFDKDQLRSRRDLLDFLYTHPLSNSRSHSLPIKQLD